VVHGDRAEVSVRGHRVTVSTESPVRIPLSDQGPRIERPVPSINGDRRPDGTLITASVPQATTARR
jgi:alpha,alpha-trehalose phosphorylase